MFEGLKEFSELGSTVIITLAFLFVFYESQKQKKQGNGKSLDILNELKLMNANHLHSIEIAIREGNKELVKEINDGNLRIVEMLSQLCGKISNLK